MRSERRPVSANIAAVVGHDDAPWLAADAAPGSAAHLSTGWPRRSVMLGCRAAKGVAEAFQSNRLGSTSCGRLPPRTVRASSRTFCKTRSPACNQASRTVCVNDSAATEALPGQHAEWVVCALAQSDLSRAAARDEVPELLHELMNEFARDLEPRASNPWYVSVRRHATVRI